VLAYGLRGNLDVAMIDRLSDAVDDKAEAAEGVQDALGDLARAGRRTDRDTGDFDAELEEFDGELGLSVVNDTETPNKEENNEHKENDADAFGGSACVES